MKKYVLFILLLFLFTTACSSPDLPSSTTSPETSKKYNIYIDGDSEGGVFKKQYLISKAKQETKEEPVNNANKKTIKIGVRDIDVYQTKTLSSEQNTIDVFLSEDDNTEYRISRDNTIISMNAGTGGILHAYHSETLSERNFLEQAAAFIFSFFPDENLDKYVVSCRTKVTVQKQSAAWSDTRSYFCVPEESTEEKVEVKAYYCIYEMYSQGIKTQDRIEIRCRNNGDIESMYCYFSDVNWDSIRYDKNDVEAAISKFILDAISDDYTINSRKTVSESLILYKSRICLYVECELMLARGNSEIAVLCPLIIDMI